MIAASLIFKDGGDMVRAMASDLLDSDFAGLSCGMVAVDNGSQDKTIAEWLEAHGWIVMRNPANIGIPAARNQTYWRIAGQIPAAQYILELHADMRFPRGWCYSLLGEMVDPDVWIACASIVREAPEAISRAEVEDVCMAGRRGKIPLDPLAQRFAHPCLIRMAPFKARGFYDDRYLWQEFEDTDLYFDWRRQGKKVVVSERSWVIHYTGSQRIEFWDGDAFIHNMLYFRDKWGLDPRMKPDQITELVYGFNPKQGVSALRDDGG